MNALSKATPELTGAGLVAVCKVLAEGAPLKSLHIDRREPLEAAIAHCEGEAAPDDPDNVVWAYREAPFYLGEADYSDLETDEDGCCVDQSAFYQRMFSEWDEQAQSDWFRHVRALPVPPNPWNYLLGEAERLVPGFSRWNLPGARLSVVSALDDDAAAAPLPLWSLDDEDAPDLEWTVAGVVQAQSLCAMVGAPGEGKTTVALALALHVAAGRPFAGRDVLQGAVVYVAAEGHPGALKARMRAMQAGYGIEGSPLPLRIVNGAVNLLKAAEVTSLVSAIATVAESQPVRVIILDTLAQCMAGGDENSAQAMGQVVASMGRLRDAFGAAVIALTHPARGGTAPRGSSALTGALDTQIGVTAARKGKTISTVALDISKQRNAPAGEPIKFDMKPGADALVPIYRDSNEPTASASAPQVKLSGKAKVALAFLAKNGPTTEPDWRDAIAKRLTDSSDAASQRKAFYRVRDELADARAAIKDGDDAWRAAS